MLPLLFKVGILLRKTLFNSQVYSLLLELEKNKVQYSYFHFTQQPA